MTSSAEYTQNMGAVVQRFPSYIFHQNVIVPQSGDFVNLKDHLEFVGYLSKRPLPTLFPLYCTLGHNDALRAKITLTAYVRTSLEHKPVFESQRSMDVPVYFEPDLLPNPPIVFSFDPILIREGHDNLIHLIYEIPDESSTLFHIAAYPYGYYYLDPVLSEMLLSSVYQPSYLDDSWTGTSANITPGEDGGSIADPTNIVFGDGDASMNLSNILPGDGTGNTDLAGQVTNTMASITLLRLTHTSPKWTSVLSHCRMQMRLAICCGRCENPYVLTAHFDIRAARTQEWFFASLKQTGIRRDQLECVDSVGNPMRVEDNLRMTQTWVSEFMSETKRAANASSMHCGAGFDLEVIYGQSSLHIRLEYLLTKFAPSESLLPIDDKENGIVWFLRHQIAKELVWYLVFKTYRSGTIGLILNDLEPSAFRDAAHPPPATLALAASRCYSALLTQLKGLKVANMKSYATPCEVHTYFFSGISSLFQQQGTPGHGQLMVDMERFGRLTTRDVYRNFRLTKGNEKRHVKQSSK